jgi:hypothetical protein
MTRRSPQADLSLADAQKKKPGGKPPGFLIQIVGND